MYHHKEPELPSVWFEVHCMYVHILITCMAFKSAWRRCKKSRHQTLYRCHTYTEYLSLGGGKNWRNILLDGWWVGGWIVWLPWLLLVVVGGGGSRRAGEVTGWLAGWLAALMSYEVWLCKPVWRRQVGRLKKALTSIFTSSPTYISLSCLSLSLLVITWSV